VVSTVDTLALIKRRFPGRDERVERIFREDPSFRTLCRDYHDCRATLERLRGHDSASVRNRRREYAELLEELDREIRTWIGDEKEMT